MTMEQHLITTLQHLATQRDYQTDKNTTHSYLELYDLLLAPYCKEKIRLLEIGNHQGGSIELWNDYFDDVEIFGLEINTLDSLKEVGDAHDNVHLFQGVNAYSHEAINQFFREGIFFDIIMDDGSHQPAHQSFVANDWLPMLKPGGTMIIEDVVSTVMAAQIVSNMTRLSKDDRVAIFDRSNVKGRDDDIVIVIKKGR